MLPAPTTTASSTPRSRTEASSSATALTFAGSVPYSSEPIRDSPESLIRTRLKALVTDGKPYETPDDDVLAGLRGEVGAQLLDRLLVLDMGLLEEDDLLVPLTQLALERLLASLLGHIVELLGVDALLGLLGILGDLVNRDPPGRPRRGNVQRHVLGERDEVFVGGDEVGVAVDLDQRAELAVGVDVGLDGALGRLAAGELADLVAHLDPDDLDGLVHVAAGLGQRGLAVHHPRAGLVAQGLDVGSGDRHAHDAGVSSTASVTGVSGVDAGSGVWSSAAGAGSGDGPVPLSACAGATSVLAACGTFGSGVGAGASWTAWATSASAAWRSPPPSAWVLAASACALAASASAAAAWRAASSSAARAARASASARAFASASARARSS